MCKRIICLLLSVIFIFTFASCGSSVTEMPEGEIILENTIDNPYISHHDSSNKKLTDVTELTSFVARAQIISAEYDKEYEIDDPPKFLYLKFKIKEVYCGEYTEDTVDIRIAVGTSGVGIKPRNTTFKEDREYIIPFWCHNMDTEPYYTIPYLMYIDLKDYSKSLWEYGHVLIPEGYKKEHIIMAFQEAFEITGPFSPEKFQ